MNDISINYHIRRNSRAQKVRVLVTANRIEVVAPPQVIEQKLHDFVRENEQWIINTQLRLITKLNQTPSFSIISFSKEGFSVTFQGESYPLIYFNSDLKLLNFQFRNEFVVYGPYFNCERRKNDAIKIALVKWMRQETKNKVEEIIQLHAHRNKLYPNSVAIKSQKSRWGSCSSRNNININWRLILAPSAVLEYVVVHELCHIRHKNHSDSFWNLVAQHLPDFHIQRQWLKQNGYALMLCE